MAFSECIVGWCKNGDRGEHGGCACEVEYGCEQLAGEGAQLLCVKDRISCTRLLGAATLG